MNGTLIQPDIEYVGKYISQEIPLEKILYSHINAGQHPFCRLMPKRWAEAIIKTIIYQQPFLEFRTHIVHIFSTTSSGIIQKTEKEIYGLERNHVEYDNLFLTTGGIIAAPRFTHNKYDYWFTGGYLDPKYIEAEIQKIIANERKINQETKLQRIEAISNSIFWKFITQEITKVKTSKAFEGYKVLGI